MEQHGPIILKCEMAFGSRGGIFSLFIYQEFPGRQTPNLTMT